MNDHDGIGWTEARVETLKTMLAEGASCSEVARAIGGGLSRNAVIGKIHRLKLNAARPVRSPSTPRPHGNRGQPKPQAIRARAARRNREGGSKAQLDAVRVHKGIKFGVVESGEPVAADLGPLQGRILTKRFGKPWGRQPASAWNGKLGCFEDSLHFRISVERWAS